MPILESGDDGGKWSEAAHALERTDELEVYGVVLGDADLAEETSIRDSTLQLETP